MGDHMHGATEVFLAHLQLTRNCYKTLFVSATLRLGQRLRTMLQQCSRGACASGYAVHTARQWNHRLVHPQAITLSQLTCKSGSKGLA